ncbi:protein DMP6-like [Phoenix dactylifera]|uniref:Protein DMP6-like n=1 Tax=Phoenix dactylifera TaxID=42345 RepID=A0A8B7CFT5_PHODC|nr:protein DMP6-like [Phoenix dactylifera]
MMEENMCDEEAQQQEEEPLLIPKSSNSDRKTPKRKAIRKTFKSTAHLANLLPTGTVLAFQLLSPIFTNQGRCNAKSWNMTAGLVALCGLSCFILSFTDSFRDESGKVRHGLATFRGLWVIDGTAPLPPQVAVNYRIKLIDFIHAFMSILVFVAVALLDRNVVSCLYPTPSEEMKQVLASLPIGIGIFGSMLFVAFPTRRHGIGFPLSSQ